MPTRTPLVLSLCFFKIHAHALGALASAAFLAVLRRRLRQRSLRNISGPSNSSFVWVIVVTCSIPMPICSTRDYTGHMEK
ncbi:hypothetical protein H4582DRAFT_155830 [Lactarius indigo]|nr:hypothetical protein H4582DRAFT_155830 [Lactarius indigo]